MTQINELKPCPFCGGEARSTRTVVKTNGSYCDAVYIYCTKCNARTSDVLFDGIKHPNGEEYIEAEKAWNKRVNRCDDCLIDNMIDDGR